MSVTRRIAFGVAAGWFGRVVNIVLGVALLPVLFRLLPREELGVWLLLGQSWAAAGILDFGLGAVLTRRFALAKGRSGADPEADLNEHSRAEIADLIECGRRIYSVMTVVVFLLALGAGYFYLRSLPLHKVGYKTVLAAWVILAASQALTVWGTVWHCLLQGIGYVGWDAVIAGAVNALTVVVQIAAVFLGGRLVWLAAIAAVGALGQRWLMLGMARRRRPELFALRGRWSAERIRGLPAQALRAWLTMLGTTLVFTTDQFFIASAAGAEQIPAFRAAYVLVHNVTVLAVSFGLSSSVFISHGWQAGDLALVRRLVERGCRLGLVVMLLAAAYLLTAGEGFFRLWLGTGNFIGYGVLGIFLVYETLEAHSYIISTCSRATDDEAFAFTSVLAGVLKLAAAWVLIRPLGLLGLALSTLLALLATNHWYMVYRGLRRLRLPLRAYGREVVLPALGWAAAGGAGALAVSQALQAAPLPVRVFGAAGAMGAVFVAAIYLSVLTPEERRVLAGRLAGWRRRKSPTSSA